MNTQMTQRLSDKHPRSKDEYILSLLQTIRTFTVSNENKHIETAACNWLIDLFI